MSALAGFKGFLVTLATAAIFEMGRTDHRKLAGWRSKKGKD